MDIFDLRREFTLEELDEKDVLQNPIEQLGQWLKYAIEKKVPEPNAMNLATVGADGKPSSRILLLKQIRDDGLVFFSNYRSKKGRQIEENPNCAVNFVWYELERQVRIEGQIQKITEQESDLYFNTRSADSKIGAWASEQSEVVPGREYLDKQVKDFESKFDSYMIERPSYWGGYIIRPSLFEFWQGRKNRLHDRIQYRYKDGSWIIERLAP